MKQAVLELLKSTREYISGEEISHRMQVSRTAIWKHIQGLRVEGYEIDSQPRLGYRLLSTPDRLYPAEIYDGLATQAFGSSIVYFSSTGSTNDVAKQIAEQGAAEGTLVVAEEQTGGRGRLGRKWVSPQGTGIWMSLILRPQILPQDAPKITLVAALALVKAVRSLTGLQVSIKWPNDVVYQEQKIVGILTEMTGELDRVKYLVVGMGINVNTQQEDFPEELRPIATSIFLQTKQQQSRVALVQGVLKHFEDLYLTFLSGDFASILAEWKANCSTIGKDIRVTGLRQSLVGKALDVAHDGTLQLQLSDGTITSVVAGDIDSKLD